MPRDWCPKLGVAPTRTHRDITPTRILARYRPLRVVDETLGYRTRIAENRDGARVVVHEIDWSTDVSSAVQSRLKHEVLRLSTVSHDRFRAPVDFDFEHQTCRIVCSQLSLPQLSERLPAVLSIADTLSIAQDLLQVLQTVHESGLVLRCVLPGDIFLDDTGDSLRAIIGGCPPLMLLHGLRAGQSPSQMLTYAAPETLGALECDIRAPADLYSLGILLFECLTGEPPFQGQDAGELLFHHMTTPVPDLTRLNSQIPGPLGEIVQRLLQKHPRDRYQSAAGVLCDIQQMERAINDKVDPTSTCPLVLGTKDHGETLIEPAHVGRTNDMAVLESELKAVVAGESQAVLITAPSGVGKSRLLMEASSPAVARGCRLLKAQGQNEIGLTPLATVQPALQQCVDLDQLQNLQMSGEAAELLKQRLFRLPTDSRQLLAVGAVLGKEFSIETAAGLAEISYEAALEHLVEPRALCLIWEKTTEGTCQFVHDQIREAIQETLTDEARRRIHLSAAEHLVVNGSNNDFEIAWHYDEAGCPRLALPFAIPAAGSARRRHALEIAEQQYLIALRSCEALNTEPDFEILNGMGEVLMLSGRYLEAQPMLEAAILSADSPVTEAEISLKLGELAFKRDDKDQAVELWESALRKLGGQLPPNWLMPVCALKEICVQTLHSLFPGRLVRSRNGEGALRDRLIWRLYSRQAYGYWYLKGQLPLLYVHLRGMNLAERFAPTAELAQAYSEHAPAMSLIPLSRRGIAYGRRSLEIRRSLDDVWGQGQSLHFLAIALYAAARFEECIDIGRRSVRILERAGDFWEKHIAQYQVAASLYRLGRLTEAVQLAREAYDSGIAVGDDQVCGNIIDIWARASNGDLPAEIVQRELDRPRADVQGKGHVLLAQGVQLVTDNRYEDAVAAFSEGIRITAAAGISNCYTAPLYVWKATALRSFLETESPVTRAYRQKTILAHRRSARKAVLVALRFRSELPHALRELAWSLIFQNRVRRAMYLLNWSRPPLTHGKTGTST